MSAWADLVARYGDDDLDRLNAALVEIQTEARRKALLEAAAYFDQFPTNTARLLRGMADKAEKGEE